VPDRADEEVVEFRLITSSPRPSPPEEERVACKMARSLILNDCPAIANYHDNTAKR